MPTAKDYVFAGNCNYEELLKYREQYGDRIVFGPPLNPGVGRLGEILSLANLTGRYLLDDDKLTPGLSGTDGRRFTLEHAIEKANEAAAKPKTY